MENTESNINMRRLWHFTKRCKWIYLASIVFFTAAGIWLSVRSLSKYTIQGSILIGDEVSTETSAIGKSSGGGIAQMMKTFSVGGFGASTVDNEVYIIRSHDVMLRTVRAMGLSRTYIGKDSDGDKAMLYKNTPVRVEAPVEFFDTLQNSFTVKIWILDNGRVDIKATKGFLGRTIAEKENVELPSMLETPFGNVQIMPTDQFKTTPYKRITVNVRGNEGAAIALEKIADIDVASKMADIINVDLKYANKDYGIAIVNSIMGEYNAKRLERLHETSKTSIKYYDGRIAETFRKLENIEKSLAEYQRNNDLMGIDSEAGLLMETAYENRTGIIKANDEIAYYEMVLETLRGINDDDVLIPQAQNPKDQNITLYNEVVMERRDLKRSAKDDNSALRRLNDRIGALRQIIVENSEKSIDKARSDVRTQQSLVGRAESRLDKYPQYVLEYRNLIREREYQTALYQYLVQSRENSVLQLYSNSNVGFVFQDAFMLEKPSMLSKLIYPAVFFVFALFAATCVVLLLMMISRKVKNPVDLSFMGIDDRTVLYNGDKSRIIDLRTMIMSQGQPRTIYSVNFTESAQVVDMLAGSLTGIDRTVEVISGVPDNDALLTPGMGDRIESAQTDYVIVEVPEPELVKELADRIDNEDAILMVWLPYDVIKRADLKRYLKGQTAARVFAMIIK